MSTKLYRRELPLIITFLVGFVLIANYFYQSPILAGTESSLTKLGTMLLPFTFILGTLTLGIHSLHRLRKGKDIALNGSILIAMVITVIIGLSLGQRTAPYQWILSYVITPIDTIMGALVIFWIAQGCFRAFRIDSREALIFSVACFLTILGTIPAVAYVFPTVGALSTWLQVQLNTSIGRGLLIGVGIAAIALGIRTLLGLERGYLRREA